MTSCCGCGGTMNWRYCKWLYAHVLEHTGGDRRYYSNPAIRNGCEWTIGYALNPAGMWSEEVKEKR